MMRIHAREILAMSLPERWQLPPGKMTVEFDDGELVTGQRRTLYSSYMWDIHLKYPHTPLLIRHHMGNKEGVTGETHKTLLGRVLWDCRDAYMARGDKITAEIMEDLSRMVYISTNKIYNDFTRELGRYLTSACGFDILDVLDHGPIAEFREKMVADHGIGLHNPDAFNEVVKKELLHSQALDHNAVAKLARNGLVSVGQIVQCVGSRGRATDIDSHAFRKPIMDGFAMGMTELADALMESRSASLSQYFTKEPMKDSEYFNRAVQLSNSTIMRLHDTDCGSREYLPFTISSTDYLRDMEGIAYLDEATQTEKVIQRGDKHLLQKTVHVRSVLRCHHPDRQGICVRCFGELGYSIPAGTNIGHESASEMQSKVGQLLLSNKHYLASAIMGMLQLSEHGRRYLVAGARENYLYLNGWLTDKGTDVKIKVLASEAPNLSDVTTVTSPDQLVPYRLSSLTHIEFTTTRKGSENTIMDWVECRIGDRNASLSREALVYMKKKGWELDADGNFIVDMNEWNPQEPLLEMPLKHFSTVDYMKSIENFLKGIGTKNQKSVLDYDTHSAMLAALHDLVSLKLEVNFSYLQTIILGLLVQSVDGRDYRPPLPRRDGVAAKYRHLMVMGSLARTMAYQEQTKTLYSPASYLVTVRPESPLDPLIRG